MSRSQRQKATRILRYSENILKSSLESLTDTVKEKVMGTAKSVKEGVSKNLSILRHMN
jgi:hypothetical protein